MHDFEIHIGSNAQPPSDYRSHNEESNFSHDRRHKWIEESGGIVKIRTFNKSTLVKCELPAQK